MGSERAGRAPCERTCDSLTFHCEWPRSPDAPTRPGVTRLPTRARRPGREASADPDLLASCLAAAAAASFLSTHRAKKARCAHTRYAHRHTHTCTARHACANRCPQTHTPALGTAGHASTAMPRPARTALPGLRTPLFQGEPRSPHQRPCSTPRVCPPTAQTDRPADRRPKLCAEPPARLVQAEGLGHLGRRGSPPTPALSPPPSRVVLPGNSPTHFRLTSVSGF